MPVGGHDRAAVKLDVIDRQMNVVFEIKPKNMKNFLKK